MLCLCMKRHFNSEKNEFIEDIFDKELQREFILFNSVLVNDINCFVAGADFVVNC